MKIAMVMSVYGKDAIGGAERTAAILANNLVQRGHEVSIVSLGAMNSKESSFKTEFGATVWQLPLAQIYDPYGLDGIKKPLPTSTLKKALWHLLDVLMNAVLFVISKSFSAIFIIPTGPPTIVKLSVGVISKYRLPNLYSIYILFSQTKIHYVNKIY